MVRTFSDNFSLGLILNLHHCIRMAPKRRKGTRRGTSAIAELSTELLTLVFEHLHPMTMEILQNTSERRSSPGSFYRNSRRQRGKNGQESPEVVKFTYYLHELRRVSKLWKGIIEATPHYHSLVVFWLDDPSSSSVSALQAQLDKARDVPLDVFVWHRDEGKYKAEKESSDALEQEENAISRRVMAILAPFVPECRSFVFKVMCSSSLPLLSRDFRGDASYLRRLELSCEDDQGSEHSINIEALDLTKKNYSFTFPRLTTLVMDGNTFMDACLTPTWLEQLKQSCFDTVSICGLEPPRAVEINDHRYQGFDLYRLVNALRKIKHIRYLTLDSLGVAYRDGGAGNNRPIHVDSISLLYHDHVFITEFLSATFGRRPYCFYHLCATKLDYYSVPRAHHLRLESIPNAGTIVFTQALTRHWGDRLDLIDCEKLTDAQLVLIADHCEHTRRLYIQDCPNITVKGLKALVQRRAVLMEEKGRFKSEESEDEDSGSSDEESVAEVTADDDETLDSLWEDSSQSKPWQSRFSYKPFRRLQIVGHDAKLSSADREWFRKHVDKFCWE